MKGDFSCSSRCPKEEITSSYLGRFTCAKILIPRDSYAKENIVNRENANYDLGIGLDEK